MSTFDLLVRYLRERARLSLFAPLALLLAATGRPSSLGAFVASASLALFLILAFRVWDDLADRARDAWDHPDRVIVSTDRTAPFVLLALGFGVAAALFAPRPIILGVAVVVLALWYRLRGNEVQLFGGHVVLLKYPAIAYAVAATTPAPIVLATLYLALCVFEAFDDPLLRASLLARRVALTELALVPLMITAASLLGS
jgi:4-hydroxybenzoate polyprenyltransferase